MQKTKRIIWFGAALAYTAAVMWYLLQPPGAPSVEVVAPEAAPLWRREVAFTIGHILGFGGMFLLWWRALGGRAPAAVWGAFGVTLVVGGGAEWLQHQIPERSASVYDMAMNIIGAGIAWAWAQRKT